MGRELLGRTRRQFPGAGLLHGSQQLALVRWSLGRARPNGNRQPAMAEPTVSRFALGLGAVDQPRRSETLTSQGWVCVWPGQGWADSITQHAAWAVRLSGRLQGKNNIKTSGVKLAVFWCRLACWRMTSTIKQVSVPGRPFVAGLLIWGLQSGR